eukprot:3090526-Pleurochrysis_carterae.AAC.1
MRALDESWTELSISSVESCQTDTLPPDTSTRASALTCMRRSERSSGLLPSTSGTSSASALST